MSFERILELIHNPEGRTEEEDLELERLYSERRREQFAAVVRPTCCEAIQKYPVLSFVVHHDEGDTSKANGHWHIRVSEKFWYDFHVGDLDAYMLGMPEPEYCPFCGTPVPKMVRKNPPPPHICKVTDGGYYCDTCTERLDGCICDPSAAAFEP